MHEHTPGPWTIEDDAIMAEVGAHICTVSTSDDFPCITENEHQTEAEARAACDIECAANARLIAAAPDMLEALKEIAAWAEKANPAGYGGLPEYLYNKVVAAVAKATPSSSSIQEKSE